MKSAPSARQAAVSKRSKSPEPSKRVRSAGVDQKVRKEQISSAYGQKVIIPRKSKVQQSREERARRARDQVMGL